MGAIFIRKKKWKSRKFNSVFAIDSQILGGFL